MTAGPGVTNGISAHGKQPGSTGRRSSSSAVARRRPRWGSGSLQEIDHVPMVRQHHQVRGDGEYGGRDPGQARRAVDHSHDGAPRTGFPRRAARRAGHPGGRRGTAARVLPPRRAPDPDALARVARRISEAWAPVLVAGSDVYWAEAWPALQRAVEAGDLPTLSSGLGRGTLAADHPLAFMRARSMALRMADLVVVAGAPLDFRLNFGRFGAAAVVQLADTPEQLATHADSR